MQMETVDAAGLKADALAGGERARNAFERLWNAYYKRLLYFAACYRGLPSAEREDQVSEALIKAFRALSAYQPGRSLDAWLYRIAANQFADLTRKAKRFCPLVAELAVPGGQEQEFERRDAAERCRAVLATLDDRDRRIAQLCFHESFSSREAGETLGLPAATVRWRISVIRAKASKALGEEA